jgi:hypothetical protein
MLTSMGLLATGGVPMNGQNPKEKNRMQHELRVDLRVHSKPDQLEFEYSFENTSSQPILVFDRMWDMQAQALSQDWAYVEIRGSAAVVKRRMEALPWGLHIENPTVPYGREIQPSARGGGKFYLPLPLKECGEYDGFVRRGAWAKPEPVHEVAFELGWSPKPASLPPGIQPVEMNGETLWLLPYGLVTTIQRTAITAPVRVDVSGKARR